MSAMTLRSVERGGAGVTIGAYLAVMQVLGVERDLDVLAQADPVGRELQDARLSTHRRKPTGSRPSPAMPRSAPAVREGRPPRRAAPDAGDWIKKQGFVSSNALAHLIEPATSGSKQRR